MKRPPVAPGVLQELADRIRQIEGVRDRGPRDDGRVTGFAGLDRVLAARGLPPGSLAEWRPDSWGSGAYALALAVAAQLVREEGALVIVDHAKDFYPVGAAGFGVPLDRTVLVRPTDPAAGLWAWEQALRTPGVAVTLGVLAEVPDRVARRLQLAVEAGGGIGFVVRLPNAKGSVTWAATRLEVSGVAGNGLTPDWRLRVRVARGSGGPREATAMVELAHEASPLPVVPELAGAVADRRPAGRAKAAARRPRRGRG